MMFDPLDEALKRLILEEMDFLHALKKARIKYREWFEYLAWEWGKEGENQEDDECFVEKNREIFPDSLISLLLSLKDKPSILKKPPSPIEDSLYEILRAAYRRREREVKKMIHILSKEGKKRLQEHAMLKEEQ